MDGLTVTVDATRAILKIERMPENVRTAIRGEVFALTKQLADIVRANLSGAVLNRRTGALYNSIRTEAVENPLTVYGRVRVDESSPAIEYAGIHEYGGIINHPGSSKFQAWEGPDGWVYTHYTRPHKIPIPERSYLRSALAIMTDEIVQRLTKAASQGAKAA